MFTSAFDDITGEHTDYYLAARRPEIDGSTSASMRRLTRCLSLRFATKQQVYEQAAAELFDTLDWLETRLGKNRYLLGEIITMDWRLFPTLFRFVHSLQPIQVQLDHIYEQPALWSYT
jgi:putative glutathione S-transferase